MNGTVFFLSLLQVSLVVGLLTVTVDQLIRLPPSRRTHAQIREHKHPEPFQPLFSALRGPGSAADPSILPPQSLSFIGDSVHELHVRRHFLTPVRRTTAYRDLVTRGVRAEFQAEVVEGLMAGLTDEEKTVVRKGRNRGGGGAQVVWMIYL